MGRLARSWRVWVLIAAAVALVAAFASGAVRSASRSAARATLASAPRGA